MKSLFTIIPALFFSVTCHGAGCAKTLTESQLTALQSPLITAQENVSAHMSALGVEADALAPTSIEATRIYLEEKTLERVYNAGQKVNDNLNLTAMLALLKSMMRDPRDRQSVEFFLSHAAAGLEKSSAKALRTIDEVAKRIRRPGQAVDVAKVRDAIAGISKALAGCAPA